MNNDPHTSTSDFSQSIQELRDEMRRDVRGLAGAIERRPAQKPGVSPVAIVASVLGSLFVGAAGMSVYDAKSQAAAEAETPKVDVRADLQAAMSPYTQQLEKVTQAIVAAQQAATNDANAHGLLLDGLAESVTSLQKSAEAQNATFQARVDALADELAAKIAAEAKASSEPTVAARQPIPGDDGSAVQPASAEADVTDAEDGLVTIDQKPAAPAANDPERGELVIDNPSQFNVKLLINGEPLEIKARGVTTIDINVGTVKTQIASLPTLVQQWDKWETVDGVKRLTIYVESNQSSYKLR